MGDYTAMRGRVTVRECYRSALQNFPSYEEPTWPQLDIPQIMKDQPFFRRLAKDGPQQRGFMIPSGWSSALKYFDGEETKGGSVFDVASGVFEFSMCFKNYDCLQEDFVCLLMHICDEWDVEQDYHETKFTPWEGQIYRFWTAKNYQEAGDQLCKLEMLMASGKIDQDACIIREFSTGEK